MDNSTSNLQNWDTTEAFSVEEVAYLMCGIDPSTASETDKLRIQPTLETLRKAYDLFFVHLYETWDELSEEYILENYDTQPLISIDIYNAYHMTAPPSVEIFETEENKFSRQRMHAAIQSPDRYPFSDQRFRRESIADWLTNTGHKSIYLFSETDASVHSTTITSKMRLVFGETLNEESRGIFLMQIAGLALLLKKHAESGNVTKKFEFGDGKLNCSTVAEETLAEIKRALGIIDENKNDPIVNIDTLRKSIGAGLKLLSLSNKGG